MDKIQALYNSWLAIFGPNPYLKALGIVLAFAVFALVFNFVIIRFLKRATAKTSIKGDDQILELLQKPLFVSLVIVGLAQATRVLQMPDNITLITIAVLKTIAVFVWTSFAIKFAKFLLKQFSASKSKYQFIQKSTQFSNLAI